MPLPTRHHNHQILRPVVATHATLTLATTVDQPHRPTPTSTRRRTFIVRCLRFKSSVCSAIQQSRSYPLPKASQSASQPASCSARLVLAPSDSPFRLEATPCTSPTRQSISLRLARAARPLTPGGAFADRCYLSPSCSLTTLGSPAVEPPSLAQEGRWQLHCPTSNEGLQHHSPVHKSGLRRLTIASPLSTEPPQTRTRLSPSPSTPTCSATGLNRSAVKWSHGRHCALDLFDLRSW